MDSYDLGQHEGELTLMLHAWPDIEEATLKRAWHEQAGNYEWHLPEAVRHAFRVEVQEHHALG